MRIIQQTETPAIGPCSTLGNGVNTRTTSHDLAFQRLGSLRCGGATLLRALHRWGLPTLGRRLYGVSEEGACQNFGRDDAGTRMTWESRSKGDDVDPELVGEVSTGPASSLLIRGHDGHPFWRRAPDGGCRSNRAHSNRQVQDQGHERSRISSGRSRDGLQADRSCRRALGYANGPRPVALVRAGAKFRTRVLVESELREGEVAA